MSANNQILIKEHEGKWYVFDDVMAESWSRENEISEKEADSVFLTEQHAIDRASEIMYSLEYPEEREYGIQFRLFKDDADVKIVS